MNGTPWDTVTDSFLPKLVMAFKVIKSTPRPWHCHPRKPLMSPLSQMVCVVNLMMSHGAPGAGYFISDRAQQFVE